MARGNYGGLKKIINLKVVRAYKVFFIRSKEPLKAQIKLVMLQPKKAISGGKKWKIF